MSGPDGSNLPDFRAVQLDFAAHIRNPELNPRPADVSEMRMQVYLDLFYNNIEGFLAGAFPVAKGLLDSARWHALARRFVHEHASDSPYFLDISQEFLVYLDTVKPAEAPDFLLELCHYEWVELSLKVDERELPETGYDPDGDLLNCPLVVNPLIWVLGYRYPVHRIRSGYQPEEPPQSSTALVVYRTFDDQVRFLESNGLTNQLLEMLTGGNSTDQPAAPVSGAQALTRLAEGGATVSMAASEQTAQFMAHGAAMLDRLRQQGIVLGTLLASQPLPQEQA